MHLRLPESKQFFRCAVARSGSHEQPNTSVDRDSRQPNTHLCIGRPGGIQPSQVIQLVIRYRHLKLLQQTVLVPAGNNGQPSLCSRICAAGDASSSRSSVERHARTHGRPASRPPPPGDLAAGPLRVQCQPPMSPHPALPAVEMPLRSPATKVWWTLPPKAHHSATPERVKASQHLGRVVRQPLLQRHCLCQLLQCAR